MYKLKCHGCYQHVDLSLKVLAIESVFQLDMLLNYGAGCLIKILKVLSDYASGRYQFMDNIS